MSRTIDERVVEMQFNNKQFEAGAATSIATLERLKNSLKLDGATKGLEEVNNAARKIDLSGLSSAVETVKLRFSALEVMAVTALQNITNHAVNTGKRMVSALTVDPIKSGLQEYETQINAVQTILANTSHQGTTLQQVNRALDELNEYADKTIYNFTQMTRNIGTFTAAGVDLQTSVNSIKGIANLAAVSGSTSQQASTAMYQLSQALAAGKVSLMDWNSVVNAGMGGKVFQDALIQTSELLKTGAKDAIEAHGSFRESLTKGQWLTTEVLTETLKQFAGVYTKADLFQQGFTEEQAESIAKMAETAEDAATKVKTFSQLWDTLKESAQSGWTQTWEILIGDFEEAKELLTEVSDTVGNIILKAAEKRNTLLGEGLSTGWKQLLDQGIADEAGYIEAIETVAKKNGDVFDKMVSEADDFESALKKGLNEGVISSETLSEAIFELQGKMSAMSDEELKTAGYTSAMVEQIEKLVTGIKDGSVSMDEFSEKITRSSGRENIIEGLWAAARNLASIIPPIQEAFREIFPATTGEQLYELTVKFKEFAERLKLSDEIIANIKTTFKGLFSVLDVAKRAFVSVVTALKPLMGAFGMVGEDILGFTARIGESLIAFNEYIQKTEIFKSAGENISAAIQAIIDAIRPLRAKIKEKFDTANFDFLHSILERLQQRMAQVGEAAGSMKSGVGAAFGAIVATLDSYGSGALGVLETLWNGIKTIGGAIIQAFGGLGSTITQNLKEANFSGIIDLLNGISFAAIAAAITRCAGGIKKAVESAGSFKESIIGILDGVRGCFEAYQSQLNANVLLKIAAAIGILVASLLLLSTADSDKLNAALGAIMILFGDLLGTLAIFNKTSGKMGDTVKNVAMLLGIATSVLILAGALRTIANLNTEQLKVGLLGIGGLATILVSSAEILSTKGKTAIKGMGQMILLAAAIKILASACKDLAEMDWDQLTKGLVGIAGLLGKLGVFSQYSKSINISTGVALVAIGAAMKILASAIKNLSAMQWDEIGRGLTVMAGALGAIAIAVNFMPDNMFSIGAGLAIVSASLLIIANALEKMGSMTWDQISKGIVALGGALGILALGLMAMDGSLAGSAALLVASAALLVLTPVLSVLGSMSWTSIVKGLVALAGAFTILGLAGAILTPLVPAILALSGSLALIGVAVVGIGAGLMLAGLGVSALAVGITALVAAVTGGAVGIIAAFTTIVLGIVDLIPAIVSAIGQALVEICKVIMDSSDTIGDTIVTLVTTLVSVLVQCVPTIADGALQLITGVLAALVQYGPTIIDYIFQFIIQVLNGLAERLPELIQAGVNVLASLFSGIIEALKGVDSSMLAEVILGVGLLAGIMAALSAVTALVPGAMAGVLGVGAVVAELALVLAAVGALAQIPGLNWLIGEGGELLQNVGSAIGKFFGGIVGGFASGVSSQFAQIGSDLSAFMENATPFIEGASSIDSSMLDGVESLVSAMLLLTGGSFLNSLASWITGKNSLEDFASRLEPFGTAMKNYSLAVAGMDAGIVANSANAAKALVELANNLPNEGGIVSWFSGDNTMESFGDQLTAFGKAFLDYYNSISQINIVQLNASIMAFTQLITLAELLKDKDTSGLSSFAQQLADVGTTGVAEFVSAFANSGVNIQLAISTMLNTCIVTLQNELAKLYTYGQTLADEIIRGFQSKNKTAKSSFTSMAKECVTALRSQKSSFYQAGVYLVKGFAAGIEDSESIARKAAKAVARAAVKAAEAELDEHSPSRVAYRIGNYFGVGFTNALYDNVSSSYKAGTSIGTSAKEGLQNAVSKINSLIESGIDTQPTIRPILDLSQAQAGASQLSALLSKNQAMSISTGMAASKEATEIQNGGTGATTGNTFTFTQNNYSPKALSRIEIYRQTKNQFSAMKGLVST